MGVAKFPIQICVIFFCNFIIKYRLFSIQQFSYHFTAIIAINLNLLLNFLSVVQNIGSIDNFIKNLCVRSVKDWKKE